MKLIVGLGNPGKKYADTRHNVGFHITRELSRRFVTNPLREKFQGEVAEARIEGHACWLLCPLTYMNNSGSSVLEARDFYKVENADLLILCDDFNLPVGKLRIRSKGSSGGQKGLEDIIRRLGTEDVPRLRIGIGPVTSGWDPADFVLGRFNKEELPIINQAIQIAADAAVVWVRDGIESCMNQFNPG
jgi:peptidyl-tRNA hydrolase, PTH1 family